ncbi:MAG: hypothetical protein V1790_06000 [Planctomycetota bacterium]
MHAWFRTEAMRQLRQRDHDLYGIPLDGRVQEAVRRGTMTEWVVNPEWSKNRHSGKDRETRQEELWAAFCAEPRDPSAELGKVGLAHMDDPLPPMARSMESALAPIVEQNKILIEQNRQLLEALQHATHNGKVTATEPTPVGKRQRDVSSSPAALAKVAG